MRLRPVGRPHAEAHKGVCSECGLAFSWDELISGRMYPPRFSFEHQRGLAFWAFVQTATRSVTGWRLWGSLRMEHNIRVGRLLLFALLFCALFHFAAVVGVIIAAWSPGVSLNGWQPQSWNGIPGRRANGKAVSPPPGAIVLWHDRGLPVTLGDILPLVACPYGHSVSRGTPGQLIASLDAEVLVGCASPMLGTPLVFLLLRQTRRRFKLRKIHLLRAVCLSGPAILTTAIIATAIASTSGGLVGLAPSFASRAPLAVMASMACFSYQTFWWWTFSRRYLKAPHALGIAMCGVVIGGLLFTVFAMADRSLLYHLLV